MGCRLNKVRRSVPNTIADDGEGKKFCLSLDDAPFQRLQEPIFDVSDICSGNR